MEVRATNFIKAGDPLFGLPGETFQGENPISKMIEDLKTSADYDVRKKFVENFNKVPPLKYLVLLRLGLLNYLCMLNSAWWLCYK